MTELLNPGYISLLLAAFMAATVLPFGSELLFITMIFSGYDPLAVTLGFMKAPALRVTLFMFAGKFLRYYILGLASLNII